MALLSINPAIEFMSVRTLKSLESSVLDAACVVIPCLNVSDASQACELLDISTSQSEGFLRDFDAAAEDAGQLYANNAKLFFVGLAKAKGYGKMRTALQMLSGKLRSKKYRVQVLLLSHLTGESDLIRQIADAGVNGMLLGRYDFGLLKTHEEGEESRKTPELQVITGEHPLDDVVTIASAAATTQQEIYNLVNLPSNHKTPQMLAEWAELAGRDHGFEVEILDEDALEKQGFKALLAVNRGSEYPARLIVMRYYGTEDPSAPLIAFVGKGVTFDTGGVNLKHGDAVHLMKSDMGGAAAVLGAVKLLARMKAPVRVIGCAPCTDNNIGTRAIKPGDVIGSYSGKTIEVINTDAEGRLILADALNYIISNDRPDTVVDLATLTGSIIRTLGSYCAGLFTHTDSLALALIEAGEISGERLWRLPLWEEYGDEMKSEIADTKNLSDKPVAGAITAAKFIEFFVEKHPAWAHVDIAGTAFKTNGVSKGHAATAYGVRLLYEFATRYKK